MDFIAIDFETANPDFASICQVGAAVFRSGRCVNCGGILTDPEDWFDPTNVGIHGIAAEMVRGALLFPQIYEQLKPLLCDQIVVCHTHFDRVAFKQVLEKYALPPLACQWLDSARVVRRTWRQFSRSGYGLRDMAAYLGIQYKAHDAAEDARAAGEVLLRAIDHSGIRLEDWLVRANQKMCDPGDRIQREGDPDGHLAGELIVFTGALSLSRQEAAELAARAGCDVAMAVTRQTTILVVGNQDIRRLAGRQKSAKHRRAEELIAEGRPISHHQRRRFRAPRGRMNEPSYSNSTPIATKPISDSNLHAPACITHAP